MRERADRLLVARGMFATRAKAQEAIAAGRVRADGQVVAKPGALLSAEARIEAEPVYPWVSRAGVKLAHGLEAFEVDPAERACLDLGASTGGFTQVLLARGAHSVVAVDVGHGQLSPIVGADPRVISFEGLDARSLTRTHVPAQTSLITADVSFIGLAKALPAALRLAARVCDLVALIKPQFESGPERRGGTGAPDDKAAHSIAEQAVRDLDGLEGFSAIGMIESPIRGGAGALEFLLHARRQS